jgi:hypothetical protein
MISGLTSSIERRFFIKNLIKQNCTSKKHNDFVCIDLSPALPLEGREALSQMMMSYIIFLSA